MDTHHQDNFLQKMAALRHDPKYSDLTFTGDGYEFKAHRAVACSVAPELAQRLDGEFQEAQTGVIHLEGFGGPTIARMLDYVYTLTYGVEVDLPQKQPVDSPVEHEVPESIMAIPMLRALAVENFNLAAKEGWQADGFVDVVEAVYESTTPANTGIREALIALTYEHIDELLADDSFLATVRSKTNHSEFQADLICKLSGQIAIDGKHFVERTEGLEQELESAKAELKIAQAIPGRFAKRLEESESDVQELQRLIGTLSPCGSHQCRQRFSFALQREENGHCWVSCRNCGKRYD
ncbi:hypothetical protein LTR36_000380 [Oleoguttula mirabilis]|uniref:BTB domain-containing protein n=1 Tax=Oleoguttula mirabilis TaxID=1507867 RepID=A0AAV9JZJ1_9PEZI|nr:hypothetical protein LTR36_000380 [Oleoguttula mirabilis]